jgi:hypothetical protein
MLMWDRLIGIIDWFIPSAAKLERSEHGLARNFVFTHLFGPALSQSISLFPLSQRSSSGCCMLDSDSLHMVVLDAALCLQADQQPAFVGPDLC